MTRNREAGDGEVERLVLRNPVMGEEEVGPHDCRIRLRTQNISMRLTFIPSLTSLPQSIGSMFHAQLLLTV